MEKRITVQPSGHSFWAEENDSILQAGLKAGYAMPYGCSNGTCGQCRARLINGEITTIKHSDYPFNEQEKSQGFMLTCACAAASDELVLDVTEAGGVDDIAHQEITAKVRSIVPVGENLLIMRVQTPRSQRFRFLAGQSVSLVLKRGDEVTAARTLSVASCPCDDRNLEFHVIRREDDQLFEELSGQNGKVRELTLTGPTGDFVLNHAPGKRYVFIVQDTGFAPVRSLIEHAMSLDEDADMQLFWLATSAPSAPGHYLENLCRSWADALDNFRFSLLAELQGADLVQQVLARDETGTDSEVFIAGQDDFVSTLEREFSTAVLARDQLHLNRI
jgi:CDP-4-dehydro-6-deoxyglucose reductase, E3